MLFHHESECRRILYVLALVGESACFFLFRVSLKCVLQYDEHLQAWGIHIPRTFHQKGPYKTHNKYTKACSLTYANKNYSGHMLSLIKTIPHAFKKRSYSACFWKAYTFNDDKPVTGLIFENLIYYMAYTQGLIVPPWSPLYMPQNWILLTSASGMGGRRSERSFSHAPST